MVNIAKNSTPKVKIIQKLYSKTINLMKKLFIIKSIPKFIKM